MPQHSDSAGSAPLSENGHANGQISSDSLGTIQLSDFIARPQITIDHERLRQHLAPRTVLVTGAGGSVGTELTAQLLECAPRRLVLADISEHNLFHLERRLPEPSPTETIFSLTDVQDEAALTRLFDRATPDIVIHAAAYKHVPLIERHPVAGFQNNTLATARIVNICEARSVEQFVLVSTDKAVEPASVLGATKRLAEWIVRSSETDLTTTIVRFGNVFGSRGSVVPLFAEQLAAGGSLKVTHPEMERYFMSAPNAVRLLLQTLLLNAAPVYALKMGEPIRIEWLARQMIRRYRPDADPDAMIEYIGRRPGEKLSEQLYAPSETPHATDHPHIIGLSGLTSPSRKELTTLLERLTKLSESGAHAFYDALLSPSNLLHKPVE